jgi:hypothetical protein
MTDIFLTLLYLLGYIFATMRVTRLINRDTITEPIRIAAFKRRPGVGYFLSCPWCVSVWAAAGLGVWVWYLTDLPWPLIVLIGAGASQLTGLVATRLDSDDLEIEVVDDADK